MFGVQQRDHDRRYDYAHEWIEIVKRVWGPEENWDYDGAFFKLKGVRMKPKPYGGSRPLIMNAGSSRERAGVRTEELRCVLYIGHAHGS